MTPSTTKNYQLSKWNLAAIAGVGILFSWVILCFCSFLPFVLFLSFLFNAVFLGSSLFSSLAQEREKRTIDALRLTQLTSMEILLYKGYGELKSWKMVNLFLVALSGGAALWSGSPVVWAVAGSAALACGGLLSISLALAVSTRCETTSSAVVSGWVSKGVWLVGLPILDYILEAVLVMNKELHLFSYLDPAWVYGTIVNGLIFESSAWSLVFLVTGGLASVLLAGGLMVQSSRLIDTSFESAATLEDRNRHSAYQKQFAFGLHNNPFMVREMAWQMRTGAGAWPGYAVFFTLFLAPFLYGLAQQHKHHEKAPVKIVRQSVAQPQTNPLVRPKTGPTTTSHNSYFQDNRRVAVVEVPQNVRYHDHLCLSQMMGLPVPVKHRYRSIPKMGQKIVVQADGKATTVSSDFAKQLEQRDSEITKRPTQSYVRRSHLESELDRGLLTGLLLTILYLFIRGGAFMSGAVTGEKERRAWDQIALTGATPESYLGGKLVGVLYFPLKQLLLTSPILLLFAVFGGVSFLEMVMIVPLLVASFLAAANIGLLTSTTQDSSHQAQGKALLAVAAVLTLPLISGGWLIAAVATFVMLSGSRLDGAEKFLTSTGIAVWVALCGAAASPVAAVMAACQYDGYGPLRMAMSSAPPALTILLSTVSMAVLAWGAFRVSTRTLGEGGSVKA